MKSNKADMLKNRLKFIVAIVIIISTLSYLVFAGVKDTMVYYLTVSELKARVPSVYGTRVRVSGAVVPGTIEKNADRDLKFQIADDRGSIDVVYSGIVPDIFRDGVEAVVEGEYFSNNQFEADVLLAKCPTKYESDEQLYDLSGKMVDVADR